MSVHTPESVIKNARKKIQGASSYEQLDEVRVELLGRKGEVAQLMQEIKNVKGEKRKAYGQEVNELKQKIEQMMKNQHGKLDAAQDERLAEEESIDVTQTALPLSTTGHHHPISIVIRELQDVFTSMGFMVLDGPELESDYYNFEALNIPPDHPARDIQDTFYIKDHPDWVMRTHTSPVQIRTMQEYGAPMRAVVIGRVYRSEATDASHEHTFNQIEGLVIDEGISLAHLKGTLLTMLRAILGQDVEIRLRPSYFPFTEPSVEIDVSCTICKGALCRACKHSGWIELLGAGMVHPNVLREGGINTKKYTGFAFGTGIERLTMLRYGIEDIRHFNESDLRFITQF